MSAVCEEHRTGGGQLVVGFDQLHVAAALIAHRIHSATSDASRTSERIIGVLVEEGLLLILCQLAVLSAQHAFLLVDPMLPLERRRYMLADSGAVLLMRAVTAAASLPEEEAEALLPILDVSLPSSFGSASPVAPRDLISMSGRLAYVCYTSGSTGRPKGVAVAHGALQAYCDANAGVHGISARSRVLLTSAVSFDPCIGEAWTALLAQATLCLPSRAMVRENLGALVNDTRATHVCSTPALWSTIVQGAASFAALECVALGGERMSTTTIERWASGRTSAEERCDACAGGSSVWTAGSRSGDMASSVSSRCELRLRLHNIYGVTECTVYQSSHRILCAPPADVAAGVAAEDAALLGVALPGCSLTLLDEQLHVMHPPSPGARDCDVGCDDERRTGQIAISGAQLAQGYLSRPALTTERFVALDGGRRSYLTGDIARWTRIDAHAAGSVASTCTHQRVLLRLVGRLDSQVKLNSMRLELGEVDGVLSRCEPLVKHTASLIINERLVAAVEPVEPSLATDRLLHESSALLLALHSRRWLPAAVCPSDILMLPAMPLTPTGKLDRVALRPLLTEWIRPNGSLASGKSATTASGADAEATLQDGLEMAVAAVWCDVLGIPQIGRRSDFMRLGGDSIRALRATRTLVRHTSCRTRLPPLRRRSEGSAIVRYGRAGLFIIAFPCCPATTQRDARRERRHRRLWCAARRVCAVGAASAASALSIRGLPSCEWRSSARYRSHASDK